MNYKYKYSLNNENMYDLQLEASYADKGLKKKMMILLLNVQIIPSVVLIIFMDNKFIALIVSLIYALVCLFIFPLTYWKRIRKVIKKEIEKMDFEFDELSVNFTDYHVSIIQRNSEILINYNQVSGYRITNHNFMLYYQENNRSNCLVIPYLIIRNELDEIIKSIKEKAKVEEDL